MKVKHVFLLIGLVIVVIVVVSWLAFPAWSNTPGGFWLLVAAAAAGVVSIARDLIAIWKDAREAGKTGRQSSQKRPPHPRQTQDVTNSEEVEAFQEGSSGTQEQTVTDSKKVKLTQKN